MYCYILFVSLAFVSKCGNSHPLESVKETRKPLRIKLGSLKNAAEVVKVLKAMNEGAVENSKQESYGVEDKALQGIDLDYLGVNGEAGENIRDLLDIFQKNRNAKKSYDQRTAEPRVYYISNPEVLEKYKEERKKKNSVVPTDGVDSTDGDVVIENLWALLNTMRREGDDDKKVVSKEMIHPRLLHLNLEENVPSMTTQFREHDKNIKENIEEAKEKAQEEAKEEKKEADFQLVQVVPEQKTDETEEPTATDNLDTTKMVSYSLEVTESENLRDALRTAGFKYHIRDADVDESIVKKDSSDKSVEDDKRVEDDDKRVEDDKIVDDDKRVTIIDFKAKARSADLSNESIKSLETYKPKKKAKKGKKEKKESKYSDEVKKSVETFKSPKKKGSSIDLNDSLEYTKKKENRWDKSKETTRRLPKSEEKTNRWDKTDRTTSRWESETKTTRWENSDTRNKWDKREVVEEKPKFKPRREPKKEEYVTVRYDPKPRIKPQISGFKNKIGRQKDSNPVMNVYKSYGRTPAPYVGKRGIYEDD